MTDNDYDHETNFRQVGREISGRLMKGISIDPGNKTSSSSIPYKFETILTISNNPKGFGGSSQRFFGIEDNVPGPGSYDSLTILENEGIPSISKKGLGNGFVSTSERIVFKSHFNTGPGPGSYDVKEKPFQVTNRGSGASFLSSTIKHKQPSLKEFVPGPGEYNPKKAENQHSKFITSIFKSETGRNENHNLNTGPDIGVYNIDRSICQKKPFKHNGLSSIFMSPTQKTKNAEKERINELLGKAKPIDDKNFPGPGTYFHPVEDETLLLRQSLMIKPSHMFADSNINRFGANILRRNKSTMIPDPGAYTKEYAGSEKVLVSGSVFMSESIRKPYGDLKHGVGPTSYNPGLIPKKKSFHLRMGKEWI